MGSYFWDIKFLMSKWFVIGLCAIALAALLVLGFGLLFGICIPSLNNHKYKKAECTILNNSLEIKQNPNYYTDYIVSIQIEYIGDLEGTFSVLNAYNEEIAKNVIASQYAIGAKITCYNSDDKKLPLRLTPPASKSLWSSPVFIVVLIIFIHAAALLICMVYFMFVSDDNSHYNCSYRV